MTIVLGIVVVLFAWTLALTAMALASRALRSRAQRRRQTVESSWRAPVDALALEGVPLPSVPRRDEPVVLELLLRYRALLRGPEAERITDYLEQHGHVSRAVADLRSRNRWRRASAAMLLGRMRSHTAVATLVGLLDDESDDVRMVAARSLATIGDPAAIAALTAALADPSRWTAATVASDLVQTGPAAVPTLLEIAAGAASERPGALQAAVTAVRVLGEIRDPRAEPVLIDLLSASPDLDLRARSAAALGQIGGPRAPLALRAALRDPAWQVRAQAAASLGALGDRDSVEALSAAVFDREWWVRRNCAAALGALGERGREALAALATSDDPYVRDRCVATLERLALVAGPTADDEAATAPDADREARG
jgi:hypothetical protein